MRCGSDYVFTGNGWSEVWQRPYWVPTCPSQARQASWVRLGPACNVLQSGVKTTRKAESDRFGHNFAIVLNVGDIGLTTRCFLDVAQPLPDLTQISWR